MQRVIVEGTGPRTVHMHWRRFALASIPLADPATFDAWLVDRWREKDALLAFFADHGHFPGDPAALAATPCAAAVAAAATADDSLKAAGAKMTKTKTTKTERDEADGATALQGDGTPKPPAGAPAPADVAVAVDDDANANANANANAESDAPRPRSNAHTRVAADHPLELLQIFFVSVPAVPVVWRAVRTGLAIVRFALFGCPTPTSSAAC
jgi:hypothetical protein